MGVQAALCKGAIALRRAEVGCGAPLSAMVREAKKVLAALGKAGGFPTRRARLATLLRGCAPAGNEYRSKEGLHDKR